MGPMAKLLLKFEFEAPNWELDDKSCFFILDEQNE